MDEGTVMSGSSQRALRFLHARQDRRACVLRILLAGWLVELVGGEEVKPGGGEGAEAADGSGPWPAGWYGRCGGGATRGGP